MQITSLDNIINITPDKTRIIPVKNKPYTLKYNESNVNGTTLTWLEQKDTNNKWTPRRIKIEMPNEIIRYTGDMTQISHTIKTKDGHWLTTINGIGGFIKKGKAVFIGKNLGNILDAITDYNGKPITRFMSLFLKL